MTTRSGEHESLRITVARVFPHAYRAATSRTHSNGGTARTQRERPGTVSLLPKPLQASMTL